MAKDNSKTTKPKQNKQDAVDVLALQQQIGELTESLQRERADAENIRKRAENDRIAALASGKEIAIMQMIPLIDNLERAFTHAPEEIADNAWVKGVLGLQKQLDDSLKEFGLSKIKTVGEQFDPEKMEAVGVEDSDQDADTVTEELQSGFMLNDTVVRVAMVKVAG